VTSLGSEKGWKQAKKSQSHFYQGKQQLFFNFRQFSYFIVGYNYTEDVSQRLGWEKIDSGTKYYQLDDSIRVDHATEVDQATDRKQSILLFLWN
jgi:hypothetical protein